jgi:lysophospholipase L1-like esterase
MGDGASSFQTTYPGVLGKLFANVSISAGFGDKTSDILSRMPEIIAISPKQCVVSLGSNDIRFGVSEATFEANYINIVNQLTSAGIDVIHILPSYETPLDLTVQYNWMKATYLQTIDVFYKIRETGNLYTDSIHWSVAGNREVAQFVVDSSLLKGGKTDQEF